jgi:hypothetical protein
MKTQKILEILRNQTSLKGDEIMKVERLIKEAENKIIDFDMQEFTGIDREPRDSSVGIFDDTFILFGTDDEGNQVSMAFGSEEFMKLCTETNKYFEDWKAQEIMENEMYEDYKKDKKKEKSK